MGDRLKDKKEDGPVLILEDDTIFYPQFDIRLKQAMDKLPENWEMLMLGSAWGRMEHVSDEIYKVYSLKSAAAYVVRNSSVARKLIKRSNDDTFAVADDFWNELFPTGEIVAYVVYPHLQCQYWKKFISDIST